MADCANDRLVEVAVKGVCPEEFDRQPGRPDERPENPAKLAAEKQVPRQPGKEDFARHARAALNATNRRSKRMFDATPANAIITTCVSWTKL